jgi:hypothetical protein
MHGGRARGGEASGDAPVQSGRRGRGAHCHWSHWRRCGISTGQTPRQPSGAATPLRARQRRARRGARRARGAQQARGARGGTSPEMVRMGGRSSSTGVPLPGMAPKACAAGGSSPAGVRPRDLPRRGAQRVTPAPAHRAARRPLSLPLEPFPGAGAPQGSAPPWLLRSPSAPPAPPRVQLARRGVRASPGVSGPHAKQRGRAADEGRARRGRGDGHESVLPRSGRGQDVSQLPGQQAWCRTIPPLGPQNRSRACLR